MSMHDAVESLGESDTPRPPQPDLLKLQGYCTPQLRRIEILMRDCIPPCVQGKQHTPIFVRRIEKCQFIPEFDTQPSEIGLDLFRLGVAEIQFSFPGQPGE
jgi:hypothetical protein